MEEIYAEHTGKSKEEISAALERDRFFTPEEAAGYGLIDRVTVMRKNGNGNGNGRANVNGGWVGGGFKAVGGEGVGHFGRNYVRPVTHPRRSRAPRPSHPLLTSRS